MANIIVKNSANADKTFTLVSPAAGFDSLATYHLKEGAISSVFPALTAMAKDTNNSSRQGRIRLRVPSSYTDAATGLVNIGPAIEFNLTVSVPKAFPEVSKDDAVAYFVGLIANEGVKAFMRDAFPITQ